MTEENPGSVRTCIGLIDYKAGNIASLRGALERHGFKVIVSDSKSALDAADALVLPGVGSAQVAMQTLRDNGLDHYIAECFKIGSRPMLGICLGMQLMFDQSEEGPTETLGLLPGKVCRFADNGCHVGWDVTRTLAEDGDERSWARAAFYFNHSYYVPADPDYTIAEVSGDDNVAMAAIVQKGCFTGVQFHPEKSQAAGATLIARLLGSARGEANA